MIDIAGAVLDARHQRRGLAVVPPEVEDLDPGIRMRQPVEHSAGAVRRAVIDEDDLGRLRQPIECSGQRFVQRGSASTSLKTGMTTEMSTAR